MKKTLQSVFILVFYIVSAVTIMAQSQDAMEVMEAYQEVLRNVSEAVLPTVVEIDVVERVKVPAQRISPLFDFFFSPRRQDDSEEELPPRGV